MLLQNWYTKLVSFNASLVSPLLSPLVALATVLLLQGCGGGGEGDTSIAFTDQNQDPVVLEIPIAYVRRAIPEDMDDLELDLREPTNFNPGAELLIRSRSSNLAEETNLTPLITAIVAAEEGVAEDELEVDIKDLDTSFDGERLIFAARVVPQPVNNNLEDTTWNIWEYNFVTPALNYVVPSRLNRNEGVEVGGAQDVAPHYLTDDRIVLSSTRQVTAQARQLNEGRGQIYSALEEGRDVPAAVLHIYDPESNAFTQISANQSHDLDPTTLDSGEILFSRWNNGPGNNQISLHRMNPSGAQSSLVYGHHSGDSGSVGSNVHFTQPRELPDGRIISVLRSFSPDSLGGNIVIIDGDGFVESDQPIWANQGNGGTGQTPLTSTDIRTDDQLSPGGQYLAAYPLKDGSDRVLVSWSPCRVIDAEGLFQPCSIGPENAELAPPLYGLWVFDTVENTQQVVVTPQEGFILTDIVAAEPRNFPAIVNESEYTNADLRNENKGVLLIDSFYDLDGVDVSGGGIAALSEPGTPAFAQRPIRFVRIVQPVPIPDEEILDIPNYAYGVSQGQLMREIVGYTIVEPDGSATIKLPANTPVMISALDVNGRRISERHDHWLQVSAGEIVRCTGCHSGNSEVPHGRLDSQPVSSNPGAQALGATIGFIGARPDLFGTELGQTMAEIYDLRRPDGNETAIERDLSLHITYSDEWTDTSGGLTPDPDIEYTYDPAWTDIPPGNPIIVPNLDPLLAGRIVINYIDHIQPIWERIRDPRMDADGNMIDTCVGCHTSNDNSEVPDGQLDLTSAPSDIDADHYRSYRELLSGDNELWINDNNVLADRTRECTVLDANGDPQLQITTFAVPQNASVAGANNSRGFFDCFEVGPAQCGRFQQDVSAPPADCVDNGTIQIDAPIDHTGLLSESELRLISEWLDIGGQYYNNPWDPRLTQ